MTQSQLTILVVSDTPAMSADLRVTIQSAGFRVAGPVDSVTAALFQILDQDIDAAILDIAVSNEPTSPILDVLAFANVPFALVTSQQAPTIVARHSQRPLVAWPCSHGQMATVLAAISVSADVATDQAMASAAR
jgi:DNA-binding NtrC family response regulator